MRSDPAVDGYMQPAQSGTSGVVVRAPASDQALLHVVRRRCRNMARVVVQ